MREINLLPLSHICHASIECITQCIHALSKRTKVVRFKFKDSFSRRLKTNVMLIFFDHLPITLALPVNQPKVELIGFFREKANIFIRKLPIIRNITFAANMDFIPIMKIYFISLIHFKLLKFLYLKIVMLFIVCPLDLHLIHLYSPPRLNFFNVL